jgi:hypothetical protein
MRSVALDAMERMGVRELKGDRGKVRMGSRLTWPEICRNDSFRGRWVALDDCTYDPRTGQATEGTVVDADEDLVTLCSRMQESDSKHCAILYCDDRAMGEDRSPPSVRRIPTPPRPRAYH